MFCWFFMFHLSLQLSFNSQALDGILIIIVKKKILGSVSLWGAFCRDAAAVVQFWAWLEEEIGSGAILTEVDVADKLLEFRSRQDGFLDTSFDTISGTCSCTLFLLFLFWHIWNDCRFSFFNCLKFSISCKSNHLFVTYHHGRVI